VDIQLDGTAAAVVDVSNVGAQVLSPTILRPNQKVRVSIAGSDDAVSRFRGTIAWAKFELSKPPASQAIEPASSSWTPTRPRWKTSAPATSRS
jgi:hypothetical protein